MDDRQKSDLIYLDGPLTADAILKAIHHRFLEQKNVSWLGPVMVFLNTYTSVSGLGTVLRRFSKEVTDEMAETGKNQAIVLGGLCGSGKTHLADCLVSEIATCVAGSDEMIKNLMMSRIVLKAIGTAFTPANKETSRLGRMIDFGVQNYTLKRIKFNCFYLDQSRLVAPSRFESNYQIFYQMLSGLTPEDRAKLHLEDYSWYNLNYLSQACPPKEDQNKLAQSFELWKTGLAKLGIPFNDIIQVLVSILLLGNITFYESKDKELSMSGEDVLSSIASLLGLKSAVLQRGLSKRTYVSGRGEVVLTACSAAGANSARDALAKALYVRTMVAIVRRINSLLRPLPSTAPPPTTPHSHLFGGDTFSPNRSFGSPSVSEPAQHAELVLSVVDLFGFEKMEANGLEQFCINWAAECLNRHFCVSTFITPYEECRLDGVDPPIECDVYDSAPCLDLLGYHHGGGILQVINQETLSPRVQADDICTRIKQKFETHSCLKSSKGSLFAIKHFTEEVSYDIISLLNSNADTLADDVVAIFSEKECKFGFATHLFSHELNKELSGGTAHGKMCRITPPSMVSKGTTSEAMKESTTFMQDFQVTSYCCKDHVMFGSSSRTYSWLVHTPGWYTLLVSILSWLAHSPG
jgi:dachs protein